MADLSNASVDRFWREYPDPTIYRVVIFLAGVEHWVLDGNPMLEASMQELQRELDEIGSTDIEALQKNDELIEICNALKSGRALRLLQTIDMAHPGSVSRLLVHAEQSTTSPDDKEGLFLRRNVVFERLRLMARIFSEERFSLVLEALEGDDHV